MAIIYSYQENEELLNSDMLVGTATTLHNGKVRKITKNFTLGQLKTFINTGDLILSNGGTSGPATLIDNILNIPVYQGQITLTTTGSSGAATLIGNTLNIPQYGGTPPTPTLQQVTTAGNTTSNSVIVSNGTGSLVTISNNGIFFQTSTSHGVIFSNSGFSLVDDLTTQQFSLDFDGLYLKTISGGSGGRIKADLLTSTQRTYQLPDASGTVALISDIPSAITLTTTGSSGSSTLTAGVLNVPTYTLSGLGGVPTSRTLTINGTVYDLTADRSWSVGTVTSVTATSPITSSGGTTPVISTSMSTNKLIGRSTAGTGVMEEITIGSGLTLAGGTLSSTSTSPLTTKGDIYTFSTVNARLGVGLDTQVLIADSTTPTGLKWGSNTAATPTGYYAMYQDVLTQTVAVVNTGYPIKFRTLDLSNGVTVVSDSRITFANTGIYNLQFSVQLENSDTQEHDVTIWLRKNGVDVVGSSGFVAVVSKHGGINGHVLPSWNYLLDVVAGEYYELVWSATSTQVTMPFIAAGSPPPSTASAIFTVTQQSGIMAGTGITAINSLTGAVQTLTTGTSGTDFTINSTGTTHTFNLPTASETKRGALSSSDWSDFSNVDYAVVNSFRLTYNY